MPPAKSDRSWIGEFRGRYGPWWTEARPLIEAHQYAQAFKTYPWPEFTSSPWTPVVRPLAESRIAVVTTGGLCRQGIDAPFDGDNPEGDWSFRALPRSVAAETIAVTHPHFPHEVAEADLNTIFPLSLLAEIETKGLIGELAPTHYSTMGYVTRAAELAEESAPAIASLMKAERVDVALVIPV
jgi:D-proline reductase (dithiol) PrdB